MLCGKIDYTVKDSFILFFYMFLSIDSILTTVKV